MIPKGRPANLDRPPLPVITGGKPGCAETGPEEQDQ